MAKVVGSISMSHSPLWNLEPDPEAGTSGGEFVRHVEHARRILEDLQPDVVVLFGPDHARGLFYDLLPPFTIGMERIEGVGDYFTPKGELPLAKHLASAIHAGVSRRGFDPAISLDLRIDHGLTQVYSRLVPSLAVPVVPIIVNSGCRPLPTFKRSFDFGKAVGEAITETAGNERVVVVGSGGMSHWPASIDAFDASITPEWRDFLIHGRPLVDEMEGLRQGKALALASGAASGRVAAEWDLTLLDRIAADPNVLERLDSENIEEVAGPGAGELRTWAAAVGAWGRPIEWTAYEPVSKWVTGMGLIASVSPADSAAGSAPDFVHQETRS